MTPQELLKAFREGAEQVCRRRPANDNKVAATNDNTVKQPQSLLGALDITFHLIATPSSSKRIKYIKAAYHRNTDQGRAHSRLKCLERISGAVSEAYVATAETAIRRAFHKAGIPMTRRLEKRIKSAKERHLKLRTAHTAEKLTA